MDTQDNVKGECHCCGNTDFRPADGFYFCTECGTQSHVLLDVDFENFGAAHQFSQSNVIKADVSKQEIKSLTSFEEANYILLGLVDQLLELGADKSLKLTAFQMWTAFLNKNEAAFFQRQKPAIPKLGAYFRSKDAEILYNRRKERRKRTYKSVALVADGTDRKNRQIRKKLDEAEYASFVSSRKSNITLDSFSTNLDSGSEISSNASLPLEYSRVARKHLKRTMPTQHLKQHQEDFLSKLKCHKPKTKDLIKYRPFQLTGTTMYCILYLALNYNSDKIQLSNMINYIREGVLPYYFLNRFLPYEPEQLHSGHIANANREIAEPSHRGLRKRIADFARVIGVKALKCPNLIELSQRYVREMCLPEEIALYARRLISFCLPDMKFKNGVHEYSPNYEGRCMAFVLFIVKLIFGMNGTQEYELSKSARNINDELKTLKGADNMELFIFEDWMQYIEMRNVLLCASHYPTQVLFEPDNKTNTRQYLEYLNRTQTELPCGTSLKNGQGVHMKQLKIIFEKLNQNHVMNKDNKSSDMILFSSSLTPLRSHFKELLDEPVPPLKIPDFMHKNFDKMTVHSFMKPRRLQSLFRKNGINLKVSRNRPNRESYTFRDWFYATVTSETRKEKQNKSFNTVVDISEAEWIHTLILESEEQRQEEIERNHRIQEHIKNDAKIRTEMEEAYQFKRDDKSLNETYYRNLVKKKLNKKSTIMKNEEILMEPRRNLDEVIVDESESEMELEDATERIHFKKEINFEASTFDLELCMGSFTGMSTESFSEIEKGFPRTFAWLLNQCAKTIAMNSKDLYLELIVIENYFAYVLQPFDKIALKPEFREKSKIAFRHKHFADSLTRLW